MTEPVPLRRNRDFVLFQLGQRAMAASNTLRAASAPIGPLVAGLLLANTTPRFTVLVLAAPVVVAAALGTFSPALRDLPSLSAARAEAR